MAEYDTTDKTTMQYENAVLIPAMNMAIKSITQAQKVPNYGMVCNAYADVRAFADSLVYKKRIQLYKQHIVPELDRIEVILYGDMDQYSERMRAKYNVRLERKRLEVVLFNSQHIIRRMHKVFFIVKQFAYDEGFLAAKPWDRKTGIEAVRASAEQ
jgi:hypothetical protein